MNANFQIALARTLIGNAIYVVIESQGEPCIRDHFSRESSRICGEKCRGPGEDESATSIGATLDKTKGKR